MAQQWSASYFSDEAHLVELCQRVQILLADSSAALISVLDSLEDMLIQHNVRLLVVDSAASPLRKEFQGHNAQRADILAREASLLKFYAETFNLHVRWVWGMAWAQSFQIIPFPLISTRW